MFGLFKRKKENKQSVFDLMSGNVDIQSTEGFIGFEQQVNDEVDDILENGLACELSIKNGEIRYQVHLDDAVRGAALRVLFHVHCDKLITFHVMINNEIKTKASRMRCLAIQGTLGRDEYYVIPEEFIDFN